MYQSMNLAGSNMRQSSTPHTIQQETPIQNSPSRMKITQLNEKLENLQYEIDESKQLKKETFETKIKLLGEGITRGVESDENKFKLLKEQLIKIQEGISTHKETREVIEESKTKSIKLVENKFVIDVQKEKQFKAETDNQILKQLEEKNYQMRLELGRDRKIREVDIQQKLIFYIKEEEEIEAQKIYDQVNYLKESLEQEKASREQNSEEFIQKLGDDILKLQEMLNFEKKTREENQNNLYNMLQEMDKQLGSMITVRNLLLVIQFQNEKKGKESNEEMLLRLLEDCCSKMEITVHH